MYQCIRTDYKMSLTLGVDSDQTSYSEVPDLGRHWFSKSHLVNSFYHSLFLNNQ